MSQLEYYDKVLKHDETCVNFLTAHGVLQTLESSKCGKVVNGVQCEGILQKKEMVVSW